MRSRRPARRQANRKIRLMGQLTYDQSVNVEFDDRTLAHLQIVIGIKLRRNESFFFSWKDDQRVGDGRTTIWIHPAVPVVFKFYGSRMPAINRFWIHELEATANSNQGLHIIDEPTTIEAEHVGHEH